MALFYACLTKDALQSSFRNFFPRLTGDRYPARFGWVLVLLVASDRIDEPPTVLLYQFDDISKFQNVTSGSLNEDASQRLHCEAYPSSQGGGHEISSLFKH
jgi:hypothetical protein